jgi:hypothetical protein
MALPEGTRAFAHNHDCFWGEYPKCRFTAHPAHVRRGPFPQAPPAPARKGYPVGYHAARNFVHQRRAPAARRAACQPTTWPSARPPAPLLLTPVLLRGSTTVLSRSTRSNLAKFRFGGSAFCCSRPVPHLAALRGGNAKLATNGNYCVVRLARIVAVRARDREQLAQSA